MRLTGRMEEIRHRRERPLRVYIAGRRGSGKTTAARLLAERWGAVVVRIADPLYEISRLYFGMEGKNRILLQRIGDAFRNVDPAWLARWAAEAPHIHPGEAARWRRASSTMPA